MILQITVYCRIIVKVYGFEPVIAGPRSLNALYQSASAYVTNVKQICNEKFEIITFSSLLEKHLYSVLYCTGIQYRKERLKEKEKIGR